MCVCGCVCAHTNYIKEMTVKLLKYGTETASSQGVQKKRQKESNES